MNIAIDARWILAETSGIGAYTREIIARLPRLAPEHEITLLFHDPGLARRILETTGAGALPNVRCAMLPFGLFHPAGQVLLPLILRRRGINVFHSPNYMIPLPAFPPGRPGGTRCVVTIHDVIPLAHPHFTPRSRKRALFPLYRRLMIEVGRRADCLLTVSEASRAAILEHLRIPPARAGAVRVVPNGVSPAHRPPDPDTRFDADTSRERTVLYVGRMDPYKNVAGLVQAFARLRERHPGRVRLRIVGPRDRRYPEAARVAAALGLHDAIDWAGHLDPDGVVRAYQQADVLVLASFAEGFGLPVIEAMACGTPVVCSRLGSLPEVAGEAALLVNPDDPEDIARALERILTDMPLARRLAADGRRQAARFSWDAAAAATLASYLEGP